MFGRLLRTYRLDAQLTQEALAERSGVSLRTIQEVEAGAVQPRRSTVESLVGALSLSDAVRADLLRTAEARPRRRQPGANGARPDVQGAPTSAQAPADEPALREPALVALPRPAASNIPWPVSSLLGREHDLAALQRLIIGERHRLVTLTGGGGSGKTRLAVQLAAELLPAFVDGVWFADLAPIADPALVPGAVAGALGVREVLDTPIEDTLLGFLRRKRLLLALDNCEHLIEACAALAARLLTACPDLVILATSREPLRITGERRWPVQPLTVPAPQAVVSAGALAGVESVRLFVERACGIDPSFALTDQNAAAVAQVCIRLDGIPLAIELAASRLGVLSVEQLAERLDDAFRLLAGGARTVPARQRTMDAALDWSYELLTEPEQATFRTLSVFTGGFTLEAAEAICAAGPKVAGPSDAGRNEAPSSAAGDRDVDRSPLALLSRLVDKSLVVYSQTPHGRRYRLLEPVRQYAQRRLADSGEADAHARHAAHFAALAERAGPQLRGPGQVAWLDQLEEERDNLRAALSWIVQRHGVEDGLRVMVVLVPYWEVRGHFGEGRHWLDIALAQHEQLSPSGQRCARLAAGRLAFWHGDLAAAVAHFEAIPPGAVPPDAVSPGTVAPPHGEADASLPRDADALTWLGAARGAQGAFALAEAVLQEAFALQEARNDTWGAAWALFNLGRTIGNLATQVTHEHADMLRTSELTGESLRRFRAIGDLRFMAIASLYQGIILVHAGERQRPLQLLREGLAGLQAVGERSFLFPCVIALSVVAVVLGQPERAARLLGAAEALGQALGTALAPVNRRTHESAIDQIRPLLSADAFSAARAAGWVMTVTDVLSEAHELASATVQPT